MLKRDLKAELEQLKEEALDKSRLQEKQSQYPTDETELDYVENMQMAKDQTYTGQVKETFTDIGQLGKVPHGKGKLTSKKGTVWEG